MVKKSFTSVGGLKKEETASLVPSANSTTTSTSPTSTSSGSGGLYGRVKVLVVIVLVGCLALYIWDSREWNQQPTNQEQGEVKIKSKEDKVIKKKGASSSSQEEKEIQSEPAPEVEPDPPAPEPAAPEPAPKPQPAPEPEPEPVKTPKDNSKNCVDTCQQGANTAKDDLFDGQDLTSAKIMLERLQQARQQWIDTKLKTDYGKYYQQIFEPNNDGGTIHVGNQQVFRSPSNLIINGKEPQTKTNGPGWLRMIRKYQIKLLQVQLGVIAQQLNAQDYCHQQCNDWDDENQFATPGLYSKFLWVCGGHSASAGHGNFYAESYTANLGYDLTPIFKQIGLDWQIKNYAMGGTESGEEVALCFNSIMGRNVDSITWDYGMTDGGDHYKIALYSYRAARLALLQDSVSQPGNIRHRPSIIGIHQHEGDQTMVLKQMEDFGMTVLGMEQKYVRETVNGGFPDTFGMSDAEIDQQPLYTKYYKCEEKIEAGDPGCGDNKFNKTMCNNRAGRTSWHPGWKYHALVGHLMAFTVLQVTKEALEGLIQQEPDTQESLEDKQTRLLSMLQQLDAQEQADYDNIFQQPIPEFILKYFNSFLWKGKTKDEDREAMKHMSLEMFVKEPTFCHTAMLPAEIRYKGLLTENKALAGNIIDQNYEFGVFQSDVALVENPGKDADRTPQMFPAKYPGHMLIGMKDDEHQVCDELLNADYKDYFLITSKQDWLSVNFPNPSEQEYYTEFNTEKAHGWVFFCMARCDWGHCPNGDIRQNAMEFTTDPVFGRLDMEINLVKVTGLSCMNDCCALRHSLTNDHEGTYKWNSNHGMYQFRARIIDNEEWSYARFSSFIVL